MWTSADSAVYNTGLSTYQQTTRMQDVRGGQPVFTAKRHMFIYRFAHAITDRAHISNNRLVR